MDISHDVPVTFFIFIIMFAMLRMQIASHSLTASITIQIYSVKYWHIITGY